MQGGPGDAQRTGLAGDEDNGGQGCVFIPGDLGGQLLRQLLGDIDDGVEVALGYLAAKEAEWTAVRTVLSGRMAGVPAEALRERLREQYV